MPVWMYFVACRRRFPEVHQRAKSDQVNILSIKWNQFLPSVINLTDLAIKRIIKMAKQISAFTRVCQEDQVGLWGCAHQAHLGLPDHPFFRCPCSRAAAQSLWSSGLSSTSTRSRTPGRWRFPFTSHCSFLPALQIPGSSDKRVLSMDVLKVGNSQLCLLESSWKSDLNDQVLCKLLLDFMRNDGVSP